MLLLLYTVRAEPLSKEYNKLSEPVRTTYVVFDPHFAISYDLGVFTTNILYYFITGTLNGPVLFCRVASVVVCRHRLSSSVTLPACGPAGCRTHRRSAHRRPGTWAVGRPTLHGGPVRLSPVRATPCCII